MRSRSVKSWADASALILRTEGWLLPLEFGWAPQWKGLPGSYKAGVWYNTAGGDDLVDDVNHQPRALTGDAPRQHDSRYGAYVSFQQQLTGETANDGWVIFFNATQADTATSATDRQIALGQRLYNETHPDDRRLVHDGNESVGEAFYSFSPMRSMQLRANLQYLHNPGGTDLDDAFVAGLKTVISLLKTEPS